MEKYQKWLIVSFVFLAVALAFPVVAFYNQLGTTITEGSGIRPNWQADSPQTGNASDIFIREQTAAQNQLLWIVVGVESVMVVGFAATLLYAIRCRDQCLNFPNPTRR
jgi:uncharacterized membrane protein YwzB